MTPDVTGGLPEAFDDGAITQNYAGTTSSANSAADWLEGGPGDDRFSFDHSAATELMSVAALINPLASANTWLGGIVAAIGHGISPGSYSSGWALYMSWPTREIIFWRGDSSGSQTASGGVLPAGDWAHVAATYDGTSIRLYINGGLADTVTSAANLVETGVIEVGNFQGLPTGGYRGRFYGSLDEAAVWAQVLTPAEVLALATSAAGASADAPEGTVPVSDGEGGTTWAYPTTKVDGTRYDEILAGTGLTSTDNTDGTVTLDADPVAAPQRLLAQLYGPMPASPESSDMYRVPYTAGASVEYTLERASLHLETAGSTTSTLLIEKSTTVGAFVPVTIATLSLASTVQLDEETSGLGTIESGDLLRFRWTAVGTGADNFHAQLEGTE